jgi:Zn-dependent protease
MALKNPKRDIIWIGLSGPLANLLFAVALSLTWRLVPVYPITDFIFGYLISVNAILGVFNLVPIPPLDGSRIVMGLLPGKLAYRYASIEPYGFIVVIALVGLGMFDVIVEPAVKFILGWLSINS